MSKEQEEKSTIQEETNVEENKENKEKKPKKPSKMAIKLEEKEKECLELKESLQRMAAEFDNYKKRTQKEKEALREDVTGDVSEKFLAVADNFERAISSIKETEDFSSMVEGVNLVFKQLKDVFAAIGVEEIESVGKNFDPNLHNAVMHIDDENFGENEVVEEFLKGYKLKDRVIRHSMVKVAN